MSVKLLAILALVPLATGPLPEKEQSITVSLCLGGEVTIPLGDGGEDNDEQCRIQACHAGTCREGSKREKSAVLI